MESSDYQSGQDEPSPYLYVGGEKSIRLDAVVLALRNVPAHKLFPKAKAESNLVIIQRHGHTAAKISAIEIMKVIPIHVVFCTIMWQRGSKLPFFTEGLSTTSYICAAIDLLSKLSPKCETSASALFVLDKTYMKQLIDMVDALMLVIAGPGKGLAMEAMDAGNYLEIQNMSEIVSSAFRTLGLIVTYKFRAYSPPGQRAKSIAIDWISVMENVEYHPRGEVLIDATLEASRTIVTMIRGLIKEQKGLGVLPALCYHVGSGLELLADCLAYESNFTWFLKHDPNGSAALRLITSCLKLVTIPITVPPFKRAYDQSAREEVVILGEAPYLTTPAGGGAELLAARGLSLLLLLGDNSATFFDVTLQSAEGKALVDELIFNFLEIFSEILLRPSVFMYPVQPGEAQLSINALRVAELLSDESNFKHRLKDCLAPTIAKLLYMSRPDTFASFWGPGQQSAILMGKDSLLINNTSKESKYWTKLCSDAAREWKNPALGTATNKKSNERNEIKQSTRHLCLERTILLSKVIGNLDQLPSEDDQAETSYFVKSMIDFIIQSFEPGDRENISESLKTFDRNIRHLYSVAEQFSEQNPHGYPPLLSEMEMNLSRQVLLAVKRYSKR